jgi:hypothetical protein
MPYSIEAFSVNPLKLNRDYLIWRGRHHAQPLASIISDIMLNGPGRFFQHQPAPFGLQLVTDFFLLLEPNKCQSVFVAGGYDKTCAGNNQYCQQYRCAIYHPPGAG